MSAAKLSADPTTQSQRAAEMSIGHVSAHIQYVTWPARAPAIDVGPLEAWREAEPIHYPSASPGAVARYHRETDTVLLARQGALVTVLELMDRPWDERIRIRNQVSSINGFDVS